MDVRRINLSTRIGTYLELADPFWIASCHLTSSRGILAKWSSIQPAALTLKTCQQTLIHEDKKMVHQKLLSIPKTGIHGRSTYCDGPKHKEFLTYEDAATLLADARKSLPKTKVGISVLASSAEDYLRLANLCSEASLFELNLKYSFRGKGTSGSYLQESVDRFQEILKEITRFCESIPDKPVFIKIPRELAWLPQTEECTKLLTILQSHGKAGIIVANTLKQDLPEVASADKKWKFTGGVICGEHLFPVTIDLLARFAPQCQSMKIPMIATGGMVDEEHILRALRAGASAVQLCTIFDYNEPIAYQTLRSLLRSRISLQALKDFNELNERIPQMSIADIQKPPVLHFDDFYSDEVQRRIYDDIEHSRRMDILILSGYTLFAKWRDRLYARFQRNLGMRLFYCDPDSNIFGVVQQAWGFTKEQCDSRRERAKATIREIKDLWKETAGERKKRIKDPAQEESKLELHAHQQCPYYSAYLFDGTGYSATYPLLGAERSANAVITFFRNGQTYQNIESDLEGIISRNRQMSPLPANVSSELPLSTKINEGEQ